MTLTHAKLYSRPILRANDHKLTSHFTSDNKKTCTVGIATFFRTKCTRNYYYDDNINASGQIWICIALYIGLRYTRTMRVCNFQKQFEHVTHKLFKSLSIGPD